MATKMTARCFFLCIAFLTALPVHAVTVAYYDFEEGTNGQEVNLVNDDPESSGLVVDSGLGTSDLIAYGLAESPNYSSDTLPGSTTSGSSMAMLFNGSSNDLYQQDPGGSDWGNGVFDDFTVEAFVNFNDLDGFQTIVGRDDDGSPGQGGGPQSLFYLSLHNDDYFRVEVVNASNELVAVEGNSVPVSANSWYHVAAVGDATAGTLELFVNGFSVGSQTSFDGLFDPSPTTSWTVGRGQYDGNIGDFLSGYVDDVRFSDVALDPSQFLYDIPSNLWNVDADGAFNTASNWLSNAVPLAGQDVTFGTIITENRTVTLDSNISVNSINFDNAGDGDYFIVDNGGGETLTLTNDAMISVIGRHWLRAEVAGANGLNTAGGGELVLDADNSFSGGLNVNGTNVAVVNDAAIPAGNAITLQGNGDLRFFGAGNSFFTGEGSAGFGTGTISDAVAVGGGSILGVFDGVDLTLSGAVTADGILSADAATLSLSSTSVTTFNLADDNTSGNILGGGTVNLDGAFSMNTAGVTDAIASWRLVDVSTLTATFGANFDVTGFAETAGIWANGDYAFNESTGILSLGNVWAVDADGEFGAGANWNSGVAPDAGEHVMFSDVITENHTVTLSSSVSVDQLIFDNVDDGDYFIVDNGGGETIELTDAAGEVNTISGRHWIQAGLTNDSAQGFTKTGAGELILDAANTYGGDTTVAEGKLSLLNPGAIPSGSNVSVPSGTTFLFSGGSVFFADNGMASGGYIGGEIDGVISGDGAVEVAGGADVTFSGANTYTAAMTIVDASTLRVSGSGTLGTTDANTTITAGSELALENGANLAEQEVRMQGGTDAAYATVSGDGSSVTASSHFVGFVGGGTYGFESAAGGTLNLTGTISTPDTGDRVVIFEGDGDFNVAKLTDGVVDVATGVVTASTTDNISVLKRGAGTLTIATANDVNDDYWFGATDIEEGTLEVQSDGSNNGELRSDVHVNAGATFDVTDFSAYNLLPIAPYEVGLSGGGTVLANTLGVFESSTITPGDSVGTLKVNGNVNLTYFDTGAATVPDTGSFNYELGDDATVNSQDNTENDLISISGNLTIDTSAGADQFVVNVTPVNGVFDTANNYTLISAGSRSGGATAANFATNFVDSSGAALTTRYTGAVVLSGSAVELNVSGGAADLVWTANPNNSWDVIQTQNWNNGGSADEFYDLDKVTFNAVGGGGAVDVTEQVAPGTMTVSSTNYSFNGNDINAGVVTINSGATASFANSVGGEVVVESTGRVAGAGTFKNNVTAQSGGAIQVGGTALLSGSDTRTSIATGHVWNSVFDNGGGDVTDSSNIITSDKGQSLQTIGGTAWRGAERDLTGTDAAVTVGETQTYFWQVQAYDNTGAYDSGGTWIYDFMMGLSPDVSNIDTEDAWQDFSVMPYVNNADTTPFINAAGSGTFWAPMNPDEWFNLWVVVNNDGTDPTYDLHYSSGTDEAVLVIADADWRGSESGIGPGVDLNAIGFMAAGAAPSEFLVDNIYYSTSGLSLLTNPTTSATDWNLLDDFDSYGGTGLFGETMTVEGDVTLEDGSTITFNIASTGISDLLDIGGELSVADGFVLEVLLDESLTPGDLESGNTWNLFDFASATGAFDELDFLLPSGLASGLSWDTTQLLVDGTLSIIGGLPGDFNGDGAVDAADYAMWRNNLGNPDGSLENDGGLVGDIGQDHYNLWRENYGSSLAVVANSGATAPEPAALGLVLLSVLGVVSRHRRER